MKARHFRRIGLCAVITGIALTAAGLALERRAGALGFWQSIGHWTGTRDDLGPVDFLTLVRRDSADDALVCQTRDCPAAKPDLEPPVFTISSSRLLEKMRAAVSKEPRTQELTGAGSAKLRFVQYSPVLGIPDVVDIDIIARSSGTATLAIYSRSATAFGATGNHRTRMERLLALASE